jgi:hypothetical protein
MRGPVKKEMDPRWGGLEKLKEQLEKENNERR